MENTPSPNRKEAEALLAEVVRGIAPANPTQKAVEHLLMPYGHALENYRKEGYSHEQLVQFLNSPKIGIQVTLPMLRRFLADARKNTRRSHRKPPVAAKA